MEKITLHIDQSGRILIPSALRKEMGLSPNSKIDVTFKNKEIRLKSKDDVLEDVQSYLKKHDPAPDISGVDMLLKDRKDEAKEEPISS